MNKNIKKILTVSSIFLMALSINVTSASKLTVNAKHHIHIHHIYHHARRRIHHHIRYHFVNKRVSYTIPASIIKNVHKAKLRSRASYINWYAKNIDRANVTFYDHYSSRANSYNQGWSDSTNSNSVINSHTFNANEITSNPYYRLGVIDGIADTLSGNTSTGAHNVSYKTMNRAIHLILRGMQYAHRTHATDIGLNNSNTNWIWLD